MFNDISVSDYTIDFELQRAYFLRDCLYEEISYELKDTNIIIYKKSDNGISEEITLDELIFYIHTDVAEHVKSFRSVGRVNRAETIFYHTFMNIDNIKKAVENMKIILKYDNDTSDDDSDEEKGNNDSVLEGISLLACNQKKMALTPGEGEELYSPDEDDKVKDNVTLAF